MRAFLVERCSHEICKIAVDIGRLWPIIVVMPMRNGSMHVATTRRHYKGKTYETHLLRRTYREGAKVKHQTLGNLSHLPAPIIDLIRRSLAGETFVPPEAAFEIVRSRPHGHVAAILGMWRGLKLDALIDDAPSRQRDLVAAMVVERILEPRSKLRGAKATPASPKRWDGEAVRFVNGTASSASAWWAPAAYSPARVSVRISNPLKAAMGLPRYARLRFNNWSSRVLCKWVCSTKRIWPRSPIPPIRENG